MTLFRVCAILHVSAAALWLGHMFFWSLFSGPGLKKIPPPETGFELRRLSLRHGGLGWPALAVLAVTGVFMAAFRDVTFSDLFASAFLTERGGWAFDTKLVLVGVMVGYQIMFGHRSAPRAIYVNMLTALVVLGLSAVVTGAWR
jgi:uncharacterized membrane protein